MLQFTVWLTDRVVKTENPSKQERMHKTAKEEGVVTSHICHRGRGVGGWGVGGREGKAGK